jgi:hypothetical protein
LLPVLLLLLLLLLLQGKCDGEGDIGKSCL